MPRALLEAGQLMTPSSAPTSPCLLQRGPPPSRGTDRLRPESSGRWSRLRMLDHTLRETFSPTDPPVQAALSSLECLLETLEELYILLRCADGRQHAFQGGVW